MLLVHKKRIAPYADVGRKEGPTASLPRRSSFTTALSRNAPPAWLGPVTEPWRAWLNTSSRDASLGERRYSARTQKSELRGWYELGAC